MTQKKWIPSAIAVVGSLLSMAAVLLIPLGLADGGGLVRRLEQLGLSYLQTPTAEYAQTQFGSAAGVSSFSSTYQAVISGLKALMSSGIFYTAGLAVVCGLVLIGALWILTRAGRSETYSWTNLLLALLLVLVFADFGYTVFFNSLYTEGLTLTLLLLSSGLLLAMRRRDNAPWWLTVGTAISVVLFARMGTMQAILSIVLGAVVALSARFYSKKSCKTAAILCGVLLVLHSVFFAATYQDADYEKTIYNGVFFGVAQKQSVAVLGLDPSLDALKGKFYTPELAEEYHLPEQLYSKVSYGTLVGYYVTHWGDAYNMVKSAANNAFFLRPSYLGNYVEGSGKPMALAGGFSLYSKLKQTFVPNTLGFLVVFFLLYFGICIYLYIHEKVKRPVVGLLLALGIMLGIALKLPVFWGGVFEISRSLFLFNVVFDLMFVSIVIGGIRYLLERNGRAKEKFGVTQ